ncbi:CBS domain-containing protein [Rhodoblastus sp.]|uniref:CBS domain-containing protein n=1 Tax=Rhodoblastus sp. TaxID=1962975 RepID=UPI003F976219
MKVVSFLQADQQRLSTCAAEETIESVAKRLSALNIGALPVCGANNALVGVISERDVVRGMAKEGCKLAERRVRDLMTRDVVVCDQTTTMADAEKLMYQKHVRHLPVVDGGRVIGLLSIRDVMAWRIQEAKTELNVLRDIAIVAR